MILSAHPITSAPAIAGSALQISQQRAAAQLVTASFLCVPLILLTSLLAGNSLFLAPILSLAFAVVGAVGARDAGPNAGYAATVAVVGQSIAFTASLAGHAWQVDSHMAFFAVMATLVILVDVRALLLGAGLIVVHHLSLSLAMPALIYPSVDLFGNVGRTLMHGAIVALETGALIASVLTRKRLDAAAVADSAQIVQAMTQTEAALARAQQAQAEAEAARVAAEASSQRALAASAEAEAARKSSDAAHEAAREMERLEALRKAALETDQRTAIETLRGGLRGLARGDLAASLSTPLAPEYEDLRRDFNSTVVTLAAAIGKVASFSGRIRGEAASILSATANLAGRTEQQAATLQRTSRSTLDLTQALRGAAELAAQVERSSIKAREDAEGGSTVAGQAIRSMERIAESSTKIASINSVIDEIAFQTNLLALNAGVEAARAGDAGRGFAVVASEVRALAQRCSDAAKEITEVIRESSAQVRDGVKFVGETGAALRTISTTISAVAGEMAGLSRATREQAESVTGMNRAITELDQATQQNAAMHEETAAACEMLVTGTDDMLASVSQFRTPGAHGRPRAA